MNTCVRAMITGFIATVVLSLLMFMKLVLRLSWGAVRGATCGALGRSAA